jgi:hypothetical protein
MILRLSTALLLLASSLASAEVIFLKPHVPAPGASVRILTKSSSQKGTVRITEGEKVERGTMNIVRERVLLRKATQVDGAPKLEYLVVRDSSTTSFGLNGPVETESENGALAGETVVGLPDRDGHWRFILREGSASNAQASDLAELESYENRRWFLNGPVQVGQSWPIDPTFIRHLTDRDTGNAKVEAKATLERVEVIAGERTAVISLSVESRGSKEGSEFESGAGVLISLKGSLHVTLKDMLDARLVLKGTLVTVTKEGNRLTRISLPLTMTVVKSLR